MLHESDITALRAALEARLAELDTLADTRADAEATVELDQARTGRLSRMDAMQAQAMARDGARRAAAERARVRAALARMEEGDYGTCGDCGEDIAPARLRADPAAALCLRCAERREQTD